MTEAPGISVVLPLFNEADALSHSLPAIRTALQASGLEFEMVCVDDGSTDATGPLLDDAARQPGARTVVVHLSRNFGKEAALTAGLEAARGQAVILIDSDLQHPPELIPEMVRLWKDGYEVVEAVRRQRDEGLVHRMMARMFYGLIGRSIGRSFEGASDFKLLDRQVVDAVLQCGERNRFFRGLVAWVGFRVVQVPFETARRQGGRSKWTTFGLVRYAVGNLMAFTSLPLRIVAWSGLALVLLGIVLAFQTLYNYVSGRAVSGFTTVILVELILGGLTVTSLGVLAFYIALIYEEQKARPLFIIRRPPQTDVRTGGDGAPQRPAPVRFDPNR